MSSHLVICSWLWQDVVSFADTALVSLFVANLSCGSCSVTRSICSGCRDLSGSPSIPHCARDIARCIITGLVLHIHGALSMSCSPQLPRARGGYPLDLPSLDSPNAHPALADLLTHITAQRCRLWRAGPVVGHNLTEQSDPRTKSERSAGDGTVRPAGFWYSKRLPQGSSAYLPAAGSLSYQPQSSDRCVFMPDAYDAAPTATRRPWATCVWLTRGRLCPRASPRLTVIARIV